MFKKLISLFRPNAGNLIYPLLEVTATPDGGLLTAVYDIGGDQREERKYWRDGTPLHPLADNAPYYRTLPPFAVTFALQTRPLDDSHKLNWGFKKNGRPFLGERPLYRDIPKSGF